jgi:hypothetical protein
VSSPDDASDIPALLDQEEDQEDIDSLHFEEYVDQCLVHINLHSILQYDDDFPPDSTIMYRGPKSILPKEPDFQALHPNFGWVNVDQVRDTLKNTIQWYHAESRYRVRCHFRSRFTAANVYRLNETIVTVTKFSDTPAADDGFPGHGGCTCVQINTGTESAITDGLLCLVRLRCIKHCMTETWSTQSSVWLQCKSCHK